MFEKRGEGAMAGRGRRPRGKEGFKKQRYLFKRKMSLQTGLRTNLTSRVSAKNTPGVLLETGEGAGRKKAKGKRGKEPL